MNDRVVCVVVCVLFSASSEARAAGPGPAPATRAGEDADRTLAPYFHVPGADNGLTQLPLRETSADVQIAGVIAAVKVHQVFENSGTKPIEAVYVFPASTRAAVHGMRMRIGERTIVAKIARRDQARQEYEQAKSEGRRASLLDQERPNVFTMSVANILPRDRIEVELDYSELLVPEDATYEFVYPTVVGPRYGGGADPQQDDWISNPYLTEGAPEPYKFGIRVHVETGMPLKELSSPSHKVKIDYASRSSADVALAEAGGGNRDYILRFRLSGDQIEAGLLLYQGERESFFLMMMEPPARPNEAQIPPREYIFLVDVSGSMNGFPLDTAKEVVENLLSQLRPTDLLNLVLFSGGSFVLSSTGSLPATPANIALAADMVERQRGGGGTELVAGLEAAYAVPRRNQQYSRTVIVVTDGYVGVEARAFKLIGDNLGQANLFAFGIGASVNRGLIEGMARAGRGEPLLVLDPSRAAAQAERLRQYVQYPVLSHVQVRFDGFDALEVTPEGVPDLMARRPVVVFGKYRGAPAGSIAVTGFSGNRELRRTLPVASGSKAADNAPLRYLWARERVAALEDELSLQPGDRKVAEAIARLGLEYEIMTSQTSFVAVDSEIVNAGGNPVRVKQALPLPHGVSNLAVGGGGCGLLTKGGAALLRGGGGGGGYKVNGVVGDAPGQRAVGGLVQKAPAGALGLVGKGQLSREQIEKVVAANLAAVQRCYERQLLKQPGLGGKVVIEWTLAADGTVKRARVVSSSLGSAEVESCVLQVVRGWRFPKPASGEVVVSYPFIFKSIGY